MLSLRIFSVFLCCLASLANADAHSSEIMKLSIPAPDQLGQGNAINNNSGITWNGPRVERAISVQPTYQITLEQPQVALNSSATATNTMPQDNDLFGHRGVVNNDTTAFVKWNEVVYRQQQELLSSHSAVTTSWLGFLQGLRGLSKEQQLTAINSYVNQVAYISDPVNYGQSDHWATTSEFFSKGGDCEDYAIAKYMSLQLLGFDTKKMRVVILFDQEKQERHAVLAVEDNSGVKILDNQNRSIVASVDIGHYQPIYAISNASWWRYV